MNSQAFSQALALESASDSRFQDGEYRFTTEELVDYARIVAYKVAHNLNNGFILDPVDDPLTYIKCDV